MTRAYVADALKYWEPRRVIYNAVQFSGLHEAWAKGRLAVLVVGTAFAAVIAHFFSSNLLGGS